MTYVNTAYRDMWPLLSRESPRARDLIKAARRGCKTLEELLDDSDFKQQVDILSRLTPKDAKAREELDRSWNARLVSDLPNFLNEVKRVMVEKNISPELVDKVCQQINRLQQSQSKPRFDSKKFLKQIQQIKDYICNLEHAIKENKTDEQYLNEVQNRLRSLTYFIVISSCMAAGVFETIAALNTQLPPLLILCNSLAALATTAASTVASKPGTPVTHRKTSRQKARSRFRWRVLIITLMVITLLPGFIFTYFRFFVPHPSHRSATAATKAPPHSHPLPFGEITGYFYPNPDGISSGTFDRSQLKREPVFLESFSYPNTGILCKNEMIVSLPSAPFTDIDNCVPIPAEKSSGAQAGPNNLEFFEAVFLTSITIPARGALTMNIIADDGWIVAIGPGEESNGSTLQPPTPDSNNIMIHPLGDKTSARVHYPEMGDYNVLASYKPDSITIYFTTPGTYPVEIDYTECCLGEMALVIKNSFTAVSS